MKIAVARKSLAEFAATTLLLMAIVGSGRMAANLSSDVAIQLWINAAATVMMLFLLISIFADISGAHLNPSVTLLSRFQRSITTATAGLYILCQIMGAILGTILANLMFDGSAIQISETDRVSDGTILGEFIATFGLLLVITLAPKKSFYLVPAWIGSAYFFTSSTSFANPAVTLGRVFTDSFSGIAPNSVLPFVAAQLSALMAILIIVKFQRNQDRA